MCTMSFSVNRFFFFWETMLKLINVSPGSTVHMSAVSSTDWVGDTQLCKLIGCWCSALKADWVLILSFASRLGVDTQPASWLDVDAQSCKLIGCWYPALQADWMLVLSFASRLAGTSGARVLHYTWTSLNCSNVCLAGYLAVLWGLPWAG